MKVHYRRLAALLTLLLIIAILSWTFHEQTFLKKRNSKGSFVNYAATHVRKDCFKYLRNTRSYSKCMEDFALFHNYFNRPLICGGVYVEVGARDGVRYSNTKLFEDTLDWTGVLIEYHPENIPQLLKNRSRNKNVIISKAACPDGQGHVNISHDVGSTSGLMTPRRHPQNFFHGHLPAAVRVPNPVDVPTTLRVPCRPLGKLLREAGITAVDVFFVVDTGAEFPVLETMDWTIPVKVFVVEMGRGAIDLQTTEMLESKGYVKTTWNIRGFCLPGGPCTMNEVFENPFYTY